MVEIQNNIMMFHDVSLLKGRKVAKDKSVLEKVLRKKRIGK